MLQSLKELAGTIFRRKRTDSVDNSVSLGTKAKIGFVAAFAALEIGCTNYFNTIHVPPPDQETAPSSQSSVRPVAPGSYYNEFGVLVEPPPGARPPPVVVEPLPPVVVPLYPYPYYGSGVIELFPGFSVDFYGGYGPHYPHRGHGHRRRGGHHHRR